MIPELTQIQSYSAVIGPTMLTQYNRALRLHGLVDASCAQVDSVEEAMFQIRSGFWIRNAVGVQLDILGRIYGMARNGLDDATYRSRLQAQAAALINGAPEEIMTFLTFMLGDPAAEYWPEYPAGFVVRTSVGSMSSESLRLLSPSGVAASFTDTEPILDALDDPILDGYGNPIYGVRA